MTSNHDIGDRNPQNAFRAASKKDQIGERMTTTIGGQEPRAGEKPPRYSRSDGAEAGVVRGLVYPNYGFKKD